MRTFYYLVNLDFLVECDLRMFCAPHREKRLPSLPVTQDENNFPGLQEPLEDVSKL